MAHIQDRWFREVRGPDGETVREKTSRHGTGRRWKLKYIDPDGVERGPTFTKKVDAENRKKEVEADLLRGTYIDPDAGKVTFKARAEEVVTNRVVDPATRDAMRQRLTNHVYPVIGSKTIGQLSQRPSVIQSLVRELNKELAPSFVRVVMAHVSLVFSVSVDDGDIPKNPCASKSVVLPKLEPKKLVPWPEEALFAVRDALPERLQAALDCAAGLGFRQGEVLGFSPDDVDWLRGMVEVKRQLKVLNNKLIFALPKGSKSRTVPLPEQVKMGLAEHVRRFPPVEVTLPWRDHASGKTATVSLMFTTVSGKPVHRDDFNRLAWKPALRTAGVPQTRENGLHMCRHYFASLMLTNGESPKAVADWLGHADGGALLLKTYAHLLPSSEARMRSTIDDVWSRRGKSSDGPETAHEGAR